MTDVNGNLTYKGQFDPYGQALSEWSASGNNNLNTKKFTGYERDAGTGLDYAGARMYNPSRGRFMSADPASTKATNRKRPESLNRFNYTENDPVNHMGAALLERWLAAEKSGVAPNRQYQSGSCVVDMNCEIAYLTTKRNPLYDSLRCGSRTGSGKCLSVGSRAIQFYHHSTALRAGTTDDS
jgi:RHS repeat-associated protein